MLDEKELHRMNIAAQFYDVFFVINIPELEELAAKLVHYGMYASLAGIAGSGLLIGFLYAQGFQSGLLIESIIGVHEFLVSLIYWLIGVHVVAALYHRFLKDGVWSSMVPLFKEQNKES